MYQQFGIIEVSASLNDKKIYIECSLDIDEETVTNETVTLTKLGSNHILNHDISVNGTIIELNLREWPTPEDKYILVVRTGIKSITNESLSEELERQITFLSNITSTVTITKPSEHEEIDSLTLAWDENQNDENAQLVKSYYIEIAKENVFYNIVKTTVVYDKNEITLTDIPDGQYYVRVRAQKNNQYGRWSKVVTFLYKTTTGTHYPDIDEEPIYDEELIILASPVNGETPSTFLIEFDEAIDMDGIEVVVTRRAM